MNSEEHLNTIFELVEKFLNIADTLLEKGVIDKNVYDSITENKKRFLEEHK